MADEPMRKHMTGRAWLAVLAGASVLIAVATLGLPAPAAAPQTPPPEPVAVVEAPAPAPEPATVALAVSEAAKAAEDLPRLHSLLVSWRGELLLERYYNGARANRPANIKSASKSVISALVGIAIDRQLIAGVDQPIADYFPDLKGAAIDPVKQSITIEDLLTMRSGLETTSNRNYGAWVQSRNWVSHALARPLVSPPGSNMVYSTGNTHLLSAVVTKASGKSTLQFAQETLAKPLGFSFAEWPRDPQGVYFGGNDMLMTPKQMLAFGEMYLRHGRVNGQPVVPERWVEESFVERTVSPRAGDRSYGYGWWIRDLAGFPAYYAWGYGGQFIFVIPDLDLVAVTTSLSSVSTERRSHLRTIYDLVEEFIVVPVASLTKSGWSYARVS
jgi:CubicO group peptidase (beta-lactamase class C family)